MARNFQSANPDRLFSGANFAVANPPLTVSLWFYPTSTSQPQIMFTIYASTNGLADFLRLTAMNTQVLRVATGGSGGIGGSVTADTTATFNLNAWNHGLGLFSSNASRTPYLNGVAGTTSTTNISHLDVMDTVILGCEPDLRTTTACNNLNMAELGVWNVALNASEIAALSKGLSPLWIRPQNLILYRDFIDNVNRPNLGPSLFAVGTSKSVHPRIFHR